MIKWYELLITWDMVHNLVRRNTPMDIREILISSSFLVWFAQKPNCTLCKILYFTNRIALLFHSCTNSQELLEHVVSYSMRIWLYNALGYDVFACYFASTVELVLNWWKAMCSRSNTGIVSPDDSQNYLARSHLLQNHINYGYVSTRIATLPGQARSRGADM